MHRLGEKQPMRLRILVLVWLGQSLVAGLALWLEVCLNGRLFSAEKGTDATTENAGL